MTRRHIMTWMCCLLSTRYKTPGNRPKHEFMPCTYELASGTQSQCRDRAGSWQSTNTSRTPTVDLFLLSPGVRAAVIIVSVIIPVIYDWYILWNMLPIGVWSVETITEFGLHSKRTSINGFIHHVAQHQSLFWQLEYWILILWLTNPFVVMRLCSWFPMI